MAHPPALSPENASSSAENAVSGENVPVTAHPSQPPVLWTTRLCLRPWRDTDAPSPQEGPDADSLRFMPPGAQPGPDDFPAWLMQRRRDMDTGADPVSYTHLRAHETVLDLVCRLLLEK